MKHRSLAAAFAAACLSLVATAALAHHSFGAEYDGNKPVTITSKYMLRPGTRIQEWACENNQDPEHFASLDKKSLVNRK